MGAVGTTFIAGVLAIRKGLAKPIGSLTQMGTSASASAPTTTSPAIKDYVSLAKLDDLVFGGWDIFPDNAYEAASRAGVLDKHLLEDSARARAIKPMPAVFEQAYVKKLHGAQREEGHVEDGPRRAADGRHQAVQRGATAATVSSRCGAARPRSTASRAAVHESLSPRSRRACATPTPTSRRRRSTRTPASSSASRTPTARRTCRSTSRRCSSWPRRTSVPITGKDFKTGQTLMKTILAPGFKARMLGVEGWYSTNILGNRDGEVLDDPESFKSKEVSKLGVLDTIFQPERYPDLYGDISHVVRINYYPPRGDNKEGWDNIDIFGWLGYPMQIKVNFLCRDSILAAPIVLDLALFLDFAQPRGHERHPGVAELLLEEPADAAAGPVSRARPVHPAHEAEEHAALPEGRRARSPTSAPSTTTDR